MTTEPSPPPSTDDPGPSAGSGNNRRRGPRTARLAVAAVLGVVVAAAAVGLGWYALERGPTASAGPDRSEPEPEAEPAATRPAELPGVVVPDVEIALTDLRYHCDREAGQTGTSGAAHQVLCLLIGTDVNPTAVILEYDLDTRVRLARAQCTVAADGPLAEIGNRCPDVLSDAVGAILVDQPEVVRVEARQWVTSNTGEDASTPLADFTLTLAAGTGQDGSRFELVVAPLP